MAQVAVRQFTLIFVVLFAAFQAEISSASLEVGFYKSTCPKAELIVRRAVAKAVAKDHGLAASLIRMHFHDCFVRGCDASILLDSTPGNRSEKLSIANNPSLRGYEVIDKAKASIESICPQTVSCADIIAFAARDSTFLTGGLSYTVPSGRHDGKISIESEVIQNLPSPSFTIKQLTESFAEKGLSIEDMVTLSGAHSIGVSHCSSFSDRLYNFSSMHLQDPSMNPKFAELLKTNCKPNEKDSKVPLDVRRPNHLDATYYENLIKGKGVLTSDQTLTDNELTRSMVVSHAKNGKKWKEEFGKAMVRMGNIGVMFGNEGEIRKNCRVVNK